MARWLFVATVLFVVLGPTGADAARVLLAELMARAPAEADAPAISMLALEACMRGAQKLDRKGITIDYEIAAIDREVAEAQLLQNRINAELPTLGNYDEPALNEFQRRVIRHEELAKKFQVEFPLYQKKQKAYDAEVGEFDHNCAGRFRRGDLEAIKSKFGLK